jgi:hypothetical protein
MAALAPDDEIVEIGRGLEHASILGEEKAKIAFSLAGVAEAPFQSSLYGLATRGTITHGNQAVSCIPVGAMVAAHELRRFHCPHGSSGHLQ